MDEFEEVKEMDEDGNPIKTDDDSDEEEETEEAM